MSDSRLKAFRESFAPFDDGNASSRAADVLLSSTGGQSFAPGSAGDSLPILLTHDLSNRDSLELFVRTANSLAGAGSSVVVGFNHSRVVSDPGLVQVLDSLSPDIHVLPRKGMFAQTASEFAASEQFIRNDRFGFVEGRNSYISALEREAERLYGNIRFSFAVSWAWTTLYSLDFAPMECQPIVELPILIATSAICGRGAFHRGLGSFTSSRASTKFWYLAPRTNTGSIRTLI